MKNASITLLSMLCLAACGGSNPSSAIDAATDAAPAPRISATVTPASVPAGGAFRMTVAIENFEVVNPQTMPGVSPGQGHFHYQLDTAPTYTAAWSTGVNVATAASTPPGEHTIRVWLVDGSHLEIMPLVETTLTVMVE